jgi:hypothetical protein
MTHSQNDSDQPAQEPPPPPPPPPPPVKFIDPFEYDSVRGSKGQDRQTFEIEYRGE